MYGASTRVPGNRLRGTDALPYLIGLEQGEPAILRHHLLRTKGEREVQGTGGRNLPVRP